MKAILATVFAAIVLAVSADPVVVVASSGSGSAFSHAGMNRVNQTKAGAKPAGLVAATIVGVPTHAGIPVAPSSMSLHPVILNADGSYPVAAMPVPVPMPRPHPVFVQPPPKPVVFTSPRTNTFSNLPGPLPASPAPVAGLAVPIGLPVDPRHAAAVAAAIAARHPLSDSTGRAVIAQLHRIVQLSAAAAAQKAPHKLARLQKVFKRITESVAKFPALRDAVALAQQQMNGLAGTALPKLANAAAKAVDALEPKKLVAAAQAAVAAEALATPKAAAVAAADKAAAKAEKAADSAAKAADKAAALASKAAEQINKDLPKTEAKADVKAAAAEIKKELAAPLKALDAKKDAGVLADKEGLDKLAKDLAKPLASEAKAKEEVKKSLDAPAASANATATAEDKKVLTKIQADLAKPLPSVTKAKEEVKKSLDAPAVKSDDKKALDKLAQDLAKPLSPEGQKEVNKQAELKAKEEVKKSLDAPAASANVTATAEDKKVLKDIKADLAKPLAPKSEAASSDVETLRKDLTSQIEKLRAELTARATATEGRVSTLSKQTADNTAAIARINSEIAAARKRLSTLSQKEKRLATAAQTAISKLSSKVAAQGKYVRKRLL